MTVNLSLFAGAGAQFFDNNGLPLNGGLLYSYAAGTSTQTATYTSNSGSIANSNPIVLDSAGRVPNEIWLTQGSTYKFVLQTSAAVQIGSWDNIPGANDQTASNAALTAFENSLAASTGSSLVGYNEGATSAVTTTVQAKLQETVSVKDFGATGNGTTNDTAAIQAAINSLTNGGTVFLPKGTYLLDSLVFPIDPSSGPKVAINFIGDGMDDTILLMNSPTNPVITSSRALANYRSTGNQFKNFSVKANASGSYSNLNHIAIDAIGFDEVLFDHIGFFSNGSGSCGMLFRTASTPQLTYSQVFQNIIIQQQTGPQYVLQTQNGGSYVNDTNIIAIRDCWIYANSNMNACFDMSACTLYTIQDCELESTANYGVILGNQGTLQGNWIEAMTTAPILFQNTGAVNSSSNTLIGNYFSGFSGTFTIPSSCPSNVFINNAGGTYTVNAATGSTVTFIGSAGVPSAPTVTKTAGGSGTLTLVQVTNNSLIEYGFGLLYTFTPSASGNFAFTVTPPTGYTITKLTASAYDGANNVPYLCAVSYPDTSFIIQTPNTNLTSLYIQVSLA
jgi:hypothetical protein